MKVQNKKNDHKLTFSFYNAEEIQKMSVVTIFKNKTFDPLLNPISNGLHDRRMGPLKQNEKCVTCDLMSAHCDGHFGHIDFPVKVYNPLGFSTLIKLLKGTCFSCNTINLPSTLRIQLENNFNKILKSYGYSENILEENNSENIDNILKKIRFNDECEKILENLYTKQCLACRKVPIKYKNNTSICSLELNSIYVDPESVRIKLEKVFKNDFKIIRSIFNHNNPNIFFIEKMLVIPNKFRPLNFLDGQSFENYHNFSLILILNSISLYKQELENLNQMKNNQNNQNNQISPKKVKKSQKPKTINKQEEYLTEIHKKIQFSTSCYFQLKTPGHKNDFSIKNVLEKKDGFFRKHLMGKRVNHSGRSVIIPDPNLEPREVGIPLIFAQKLYFKEIVTSYNFSLLKKLVINGVHQYPGANFVEENGVLKNLKFIPLQERRMIAANLLVGEKVVYRQMRNGDVVLLNRQPTLHKPSLMAHTVRVLNEKVIRMHYSNCAGYNADFDGDEMNIHFLQDHISRAEAYNLCTVDENYFNSNFKPLAGLIQDHIVIAFHLTLKNRFLTEDEYKYLINVRYNISTWGKEEKEKPIKLETPAFLRPRKLYTGKQVITTVLKNLNLDFNYEGNNKFRNYLKDKSEETILIRNGVLLKGLLDKSQLGATKDSFVHIIGEIYGFVMSGNFLSIMTAVLNRMLIKNGYSFSINDFLLNEDGEEFRKSIYENGMKNIINRIDKDSNYSEAEQKRDINNVSADILNAVQNCKVNKFPYNNFENIILTGAKGSTVNLSHIMVLLGQQELEGQRVKLSSNNFTLPMFRNLYPQARGHVFGRFFSGLAPHEYFFHSMAGREGLIDTAIKTANSGYLQRCLMKNMEGLKVEYDNTVRNSQGITQFKYYDNNIRDIKDVSANLSGNKKINNEKFKVVAGENVGALAAQSIGEPSTQMTMNTFHLAGVGGLNVTLGMPRLKELLLSALNAKSIILSLEIKETKETNKAEEIYQILKKYEEKKMADIIKKVSIKEESKQNSQKISFTVKFFLNEEICTDEKISFEKLFLAAIYKKAKSASKEIKMKKQKTESMNDDLEKDEENLEEDLENSENNKLEEEEDLEVSDKSESTENENIQKTEISEIDKKIDKKIDEELKKTFNSNISEFEIQFSLSPAEKIMAFHLIEQLIDSLTIKTYGVKKISKNKENIFFEGANFESVLKIFNHAKQTNNSKEFSEIFSVNNLKTNDVKTAIEFLGIEAGKIVLFEEVRKVFDGYGISIDIRHLILLVDFITQKGIYCGANRHQMDDSLLQKMSFESGYKQLKNATVFMKEDDLTNPSSLICLGQKIKGGTGCVELEFDNSLIKNK